MKETIVIKHIKGAPGLRIFGLGPRLIPIKGLAKLKNLLDQNTTWAQNRNLNDLKNCLKKSDVIVSIWMNQKILGFGRGLSDGIYRGVLWDIVIDKKYQGHGYGKIIIKSLLDSKIFCSTEKIYLMTSNKKDFYSQLDFKKVLHQDLLVKEYKSNF